ncbi:histidinol-phosphate transaminase [uncultured Psychroserpens sp.]|uniref:histidinol-phosphate transaminase n=1 Tax=uncultured Psychroserpens sp. TaxID=255436 RepID=UPI00261A4E3E|nr:histidinol-phosphate transaminase [uncultured Psychroserpens sp.]
MTKQFRLNSLIRANVKAMKPYSSARDDYKGISGDMTFLDANENPFENGLNRYPDPQQSILKMKLSELNNIPNDNILLGNGSDEVLDLIFRAFCDPGKDEVIIIRPTYGMYEVLANLNDVAIQEIFLDADFDININNIVNGMNMSTKILFLCSPNNPTGQSFTREKVERLLLKFNGLVVIDEAYIDFSNQASWLTRLNDFPNLIVTQTLSKAYGMAGIRLGICYASKEIISVLNRIKPPYNINTLTQQKALERLSKSKMVYDEIQKILMQRDRLSSQLNTISFVENVFPSDANFILVKVDNAQLRYDQLLKKQIVVRNRTNESGCENCLRFTVGTETENEKLINALKQLT